MVGPFDVPGYDVLAPLDATGRSWRAVCLADGRRVVLRRWVGGAARVADVRRRAALWGSIAGAGVAAVRDVVVVSHDLVVVTDLAVGGGLDVLIARRGALTAGQVVTVVAPVAQTLAAAHERGLAHGRISPSNIVLDHDGRPMLTDWLIAGDSDSAADVSALASMAMRCLPDDAPEPMLTALRSAVDARTLADALLTAAPAEPLLTSPVAVIQDGGLRGELVVARRGVVGAVVVIAVAIALAIGGGIVWGRGESVAGGVALPPRIRVSTTPASIPTASPEQASVDWSSLVDVLERRRLRAVVSGDRRVLAAAEMRGTALWRHDVRLIAQLRDKQVRLRDTHIRVRSVRAQSVRPRVVLLRVADASSSYDVVNMRLRQVNGVWLIAGVSRRSR